MKKIASLLFLLGASTAAAAGPRDVPAVNRSEITFPSSIIAPSNRRAIYPLEFRTVDGTGNNRQDPARGAAPAVLLRMAPSDYGDGAGSPAGMLERSAREISNVVVAQDHDTPNAKRTSDYLWQWGQFIDHDMDLTPGASPSEFFNIPVPLGDPQFDPNSTGLQTIELTRSLYTFVNGVREQINTDTAFLDASQVYGSDTARALELRTLDGTGRLKTSAGDLLPYNVNGFPNAPANTPDFFLAGDVRANEQVGLLAMHTLFMREHNYWAGVIHAQEPALDGDGIYLRARAIVGAEIQIVTYREFLPALARE